MDTLSTLPVLLDIVVHLPLHSVLALRRTCRSLYAITRLRSLWTLLFRHHVLEKQIPYPSLDDTPLAHLSADELESLTCRALTLRQNWTSPEPLPRRHLTFNTPREPSARTIFLQFLPGRSNRWLISVRMTVRPRMYLLQCWDAASDQPRCVAELRHADGPYGGVVLNSDPNSAAVLALQSAQTETFSINFDANDPDSAFETEGIIDGLRELHLLSGSTLVTRHINDGGGGALSLWHLPDLRQESLQLLNPSLIQLDDRVQAIHLAHDYALVVRVQSIEIYTTTPRSDIPSVRDAPIAYPLAQFKFQWRTDTVVLCEQHTSSPSPSPRPIHLFVRFGSIYPWPVNVLHHYLFHPNPCYQHGHTAAPLPTPPHASSPIAVTTECNLPYDPRPCLIQTINSPVRLFGQSAMTIGRHGTALWLDNHTEEWWGGPSERGQRLAATVLQVQLGNRNEVGGTGVHGKPAQETPTLTADAEPIISKSSGAMMVFGVRDDDAWTRIAMEEEAGRIAIGHTDGAITLLEY